MLAMAMWASAALMILLGNVVARKSRGTRAVDGRLTDDLESFDIDPSDWDLVCRLLIPEKTTTTTTARTTTSPRRKTTTKPKTTTRKRRTTKTTTKTTTPVPPTDDKCGISTAQVNNRIIGGQFAEPHTWPWQILLSCSNATHSTSCGGSLISDGWIVTAAHCISAQNFHFNVFTQCEVSLGKHYFRNWPVDPAVVRSGIRRFFIHDLYDLLKPQLGYDIALLKLDKTVSYNDNIRPICLSFDLAELNGDSFCYTTGWGIDDLQKSVSAVSLRQLQMPIQEDDFCGFTKAAIGPIICTGNWVWRQDICNGDSGGPLACKERNGKWYLRGVASMAAYGCNSVASYTKVTGLKNWITSTLLLA